MGPDQAEHFVEPGIIDDDEERDIAFAQEAALAADARYADPVIGECLDQAALVLPLNNCD
jgi:hypothetical protein